jgi:RNA polymerase sigma-70 factor (ECF subfamily)
VIADDATMAQLMVRAQAGDRQAYGVLLTEASRWLKRYFARRSAPSAIDDLIQETLLSVHRKLASFDPARPFLPWLAAIARYRWVDHLRRAYRAAEVELADDVAVESEEDEIGARISLERLFGLLPPGQARAIELVKIKGHSVAEAARHCGQSEPLIKTNIHRGLKKLAALIEKAE